MRFRRCLTTLRHLYSASHRNGVQIRIGRPLDNLGDRLLPHPRLRPRPDHGLHEPPPRPLQHPVVPGHCGSLQNVHLGWRRPTKRMNTT